MGAGTAAAVTQDDEEMNFDGYHVDGMSGRACFYWTFLLGFLLSLGVHGEDKCFEGNFNDYVTIYVLKDHWFQIKHFQRPGEAEEDRYILLSIINMMCNSISKNHKILLGEDCKNLIPPNESTFHEKLMYSYRLILCKLKDKNEILNTSEICMRHKCESQNVSYVDPDTLKTMYHKSCQFNGTLPACPTSRNFTPTPLSTTKEQSTSVTSEVNNTTTTISTSHLRVTSSPSEFYNRTSTISTSVTPSPSELSNMTTSKSTGPGGKQDSLCPNGTKDKQDFLFLPSLLIFSVLMNVVMIIILLCQRRSRRTIYLQGISGNPCPVHDNVQLLSMQSEDRTFMCKEANGISSYQVT